MKIVLTSDNHGDMHSLKKIAQIHNDASLYLSCGDSELSDVYIYPFVSVKGNCDYFSNYNNNIIVKTPIGNMMIKHHPILTPEEIKQYDVKIFVHGHTHVRRFEMINNVIYINPGAIKNSRDGHYGSYAIVNITEENVKVEFKSI
jgi:putative phosphoesterase